MNHRVTFFFFVSTAVAMAGKAQAPSTLAGKAVISAKNRGGLATDAASYTCSALGASMTDS